MSPQSYEYVKCVTNSRLHDRLHFSHSHQLVLIDIEIKVRSFTQCRESVCLLFLFDLFKANLKKNIEHSFNCKNGALCQAGVLSATLQSGDHPPDLGSWLCQL